MKRLILLFLVLFCCSSFALSSPTEDITKLGVGARPMGMGKAFVALADDGNSIFLNPAGLSELKNWQVTSMYVNMMEGDLPYTVLSGSVPLKTGNIGVGIISTGTLGIISPQSQSISYFDYYDRIIFMSYAADAKKLFRGNDIVVGGNFKMFYKGFNGTSANNGFGTNFDLGLKYKHNEKLTWGLNIQNILPSNVVWTTKAADEIPMLVKMGLAARVLDNRATVAMDCDMSPSRNQPACGHVGAEWPVNKVLTLRVGADQVVSAASVTSTNPTAGLGLNFRGMRFDYAYHPFQESFLGISHFVSLSYSPDNYDGAKPANTKVLSVTPVPVQTVEKEIFEVPKKENVKLKVLQW